MSRDLIYPAGIIVLLAVTLLGVLGVVSYFIIEWATTGADWFVVLGYRLHKVSFVSGVVIGGLLLGGGGATRSD